MHNSFHYSTLMELHLRLNVSSFRWAIATFNHSLSVTFLRKGQMSHVMTDY